MIKKYHNNKQQTNPLRETGGDFKLHSSYVTLQVISSSNSIIWTTECVISQCRLHSSYFTIHTTQFTPNFNVHISNSITSDPSVHTSQFRHHTSYFTFYFTLRTKQFRVHTSKRHSSHFILHSQNIFDFTTAGDWDCVAVVERLPALHYSVDFIFLSFGIMGFIVEL